jgi:serine/threonine protein kinase
VALEITTQVAAGLAAVHKQKLVHRDIKPSNIMVSVEEGSTVTAKIIELGLAKTVQERGSQPAISALGAFAGTPEFASPEQFAERKPGDYKLTPADGIRMNWESFLLVESRPASVRPMSVEFLSKLVNRLIPTIRQARQWCITGAKLVYQYQSGVAPGTLMLS